MQFAIRRVLGEDLPRKAGADEDDLALTKRWWYIRLPGCPPRLVNVCPRYPSHRQWASQRGQRNRIRPNPRDRTAATAVPVTSALRPIAAPAASAACCGDARRTRPTCPRAARVLLSAHVKMSVGASSRRRN